MHILRASKPADENSWIAALAPFWNQCYKCQSTKSLQISAGWQKGPYEYSVEIIKAKSHKWSGNRRALELEHQWMILASMTGQEHILNWLSPTHSVEGDFQTNQSSKAKTTIHKMEQFFCFFFFFSCLGGCRTTFIAASKTAFTFCKSSFTKQLRVSLGAENIHSVPSMNTQLVQFMERSHKTPKGIRIKTWI